MTARQSRRAGPLDGMPLDVARSAFEWLVAGPHPVAVNGRLFRGLPPRRVPLNELRDVLLRRQCPQSTRDEVWAHLVLLSRAEGATWTVACVGLALPALTVIAAKLSARFANDPSDIHAAILAGFLAELRRIDLRKPRIMSRLRWAAYRGGHACVREALDAPTPSGTDVAAQRSEGHPDLVLARAVTERIITAEEAELIAVTRLDNRSLAAVAAERSVSYMALWQVRNRAERRLAAYLTGNTDIPPRRPRTQKPARGVSTGRDADTTMHEPGVPRCA